jgi:hypothetical protein
VQFFSGKDGASGARKIWPFMLLTALQAINPERILTERHLVFLDLPGLLLSTFLNRFTLPP